MVHVKSVPMSSGLDRGGAYPSASDWRRCDDGSLEVIGGDEAVVATYAPGQWLVVWTDAEASGEQA
jgi:hypothetical protein